MLYLPFPITLAICAPQELSSGISTQWYVSWPTIGNSSSPYFHLKFIGFTFFSLQTTTVHFLTFAVTHLGGGVLSRMGLTLGEGTRMVVVSWEGQVGG